MRKIYTIMRLRCFLFNLLILTSLNANAQEILKPMDRPLLLSGNFGELRATHFHSGIDIRTGGVEGVPVICVKDGKVARVSVSPIGYGRALYIEHTDGTTTVYGHLQRFNDQITKKVRQIQYEQESFKIDEDWRSEGWLVFRGDTIAYSGNTGSSGGPHLHFEVRDTRTEYPINPLLFYKIKDTKSPVARAIYLYRESSSGCVELIRRIALKGTDGSTYSAGLQVVPEGNVGIAVFAVDYMDDSWNKLGLYQLKVLQGQNTVFEMRADTSSFEHGHLINTLKDFDCFKKKETVYRCFGNYQAELIGLNNRNRGWIAVSKDSIVPIEVLLEDINGNRTSVILSLKGRKALPDAEEDILRCDQAYRWDFQEGLLELEKGSLAVSIPKKMKVEKDTLSGKEIFVFAEKDTPLLKKARLFIAGKFERNALICEIDPAGEKYPLPTYWDEEGIRAEIAYLSRYAVANDSLAPEISFWGRFQDGSLKFKVKDDFSGLAAYRGEVNGKWVLMAYDPRSDMLCCNLSEPVFLLNQENEVRVMAADRVGNKRELIIKVRK